MFSYFKTGLLTILMGLISFSLIAGEGDAKTKAKIPLKTKQGKSVTTKDGKPVFFKAKGKGKSK